MAESLIISAAVAILNKLIPLATEQVSLAWGFKEELQMLRTNLETVQALLHDAEIRQVHLKSLQLWLKNLNSVARQADDVLDEFAFEALRRQVEVQNRLENQVHDFFSRSNPVVFRLRMASKVKNINFLLDKIFKKANEIGLRQGEILNSTGTELIREIRKNPPFVDDSKVVGRDGDVLTILDMLLNCDDTNEDLSVVAIVGMAGLGKTTLAQLVYKDEKVVRSFDTRIWVCVSDDFNVERLLNEMGQSVCGINFGISNVEAMVRKLGENLNGKKFLLVLDDVCNEDMEKWEHMRNSLLGINGGRGSKIMVTTRSDVVVSTMQTSLTHRLVELSGDDSWTIFKQRAFAKGGPSETSNLVVGRSIVERCKGVPLAIKSLGGLMYSKKHEHEWLLIQGNEIWTSPEMGNGIFPILRLSFDHLPSPSLKQCFAYCSVLPKDISIWNDRLIQLWISQGYLQPYPGSNLVMEDVGNDYFNILLRNSLLQDVQKDECNNIITCKMHDLVHDLALYVSKNDCLNLEASDEVKDFPEVQHLSLIHKEGELLRVPKEKTKKLRTLFSASNLPDSVKDFKSLRALSLVCFGINKLPCSISKLIHLRYLDVSRTSIKELPNSITKLYNLQTLRCQYLKKLPRDFWKLVSLRHFYIVDEEETRKLMPVMIGRLTSLQTLPFFVVGENWGHRIEELGRLSNLRGTLKIYSLEHVKDRKEAQNANLSRKLNILDLKLQWGHRVREEDVKKDEDVFEGLEPHENLKSLMIENFGGRNFASWMTMPERSRTLALHNLVKIVLKNCIRCEQIPSLGQLPYLEVVEVVGLHNVKSIGSEFYGHGHTYASSSSGAVVTVFPALRELTLSEMPNLVEWSAPIYSLSAGKVFPNLEMLKIFGCPGLIRAPSHFPALKDLYLDDINSVALEKMSSKLTSLINLRIRGASGSEFNIVLEELLDNNRCLRTLDITRCSELSCLPDGLQKLLSLEKLYLISCHNLTSLPYMKTQSLTSLRTIWLRDCNKLTCLPDLAPLEELRIYQCPSLITMPDLESLISLRTLAIVGCGRFTTCWPKGLFCLSRLRRLDIGGFLEELDYFPWPSTYSRGSASTVKDDNIDSSQQHDLLISLDTLSLWGWPKLKSLPKQLQHLTALGNLIIHQFDGLEALPEWLGNLSSLEWLQLWECKKLMKLPTVEAMRRLTNLRYLTIDKCPLLEERCDEESGTEWCKIDHIPSIMINGHRIRWDN